MQQVSQVSMRHAPDFSKMQKDIKKHDDCVCHSRDWRQNLDGGE